MKKPFFTLLLSAIATLAQAQQLGLYNTGTLYDAFENPSQKAFQADSSRKFAFNFFIPTVSFNASFRGPAENNFNSLIYRGIITGNGLAIGENEVNTITASSNNYIFMFRIFNRVQYNREMGFSWQIRNDGRANVTNETFAVMHNYLLFEDDQYSEIFNNNGHNQSYNQYSFSFREDYNRRLSLGVKLSLLSGITYNSLDVQQSGLLINRDNDELDITLKGNFKSNILQSDLNRGIINPTFRDPGASVSLGGSYKFRGGWFLLGNLKDIGFIKWNKKSYNYNFDQDINVTDAANGTSDEIISDEIGRLLNRTRENGGYSTMINGKAEALLNKNFGKYHPNFIVSKNLFYPGGHVALVNNYKVRNFVFTATTGYNLDKYFQVGAQAMIKAPNIEFFIGSDQPLKTIGAFRNSKSNEFEFQSTKNFSAASAYLGFALKFGPPMEHPTNANYIPGMNADLKGGGFFNRLFKKGN